MRHLCALSTIVISAAALAQPTPRPEGQVQHHGAVGYIVPAGWTVQNAGAGVTILTLPVAPQLQPCQIRMLPPTRVQGDLATLGFGLVQQFSNENHLGPYQASGSDVRQSREEGVSGTGWTYVDLDGQLGQSGITVRVLMVQMGDQVLPIVGFSKSIDCLGSPFTRDNDIWALLFHSLQVPGYTQDSPQLAQQLVGMWSSASGGAGTSEIYAPNGHFSTVAVYQSYEASATPGMVWEVDRSWQGEGTYDVQGDRVHTHNTHRTDARQDITRYFSIVRMPNASGGFDSVLRVVDRSWDGGRTWGFSPSGNYVTHMKKSSH